MLGNVYLQYLMDTNKTLHEKYFVLFTHSIDFSILEDRLMYNTFLFCFYVCLCELESCQLLTGREIEHQLNFP